MGRLKKGWTKFICLGKQGEKGRWYTNFVKAPLRTIISVSPFRAEGTSTKVWAELVWGWGGVSASLQVSAFIRTQSVHQRDASLPYWTLSPGVATKKLSCATPRHNRRRFQRDCPITIPVATNYSQIVRNSLRTNLKFYFFHRQWLEVTF